MLPVTDPTLDLLVLQLILHTALVRLLLLGIRLPVDARSEQDVLADGGRVEGWTLGVPFLQPEFRPCFAFGDPWVDVLLHDRRADSSRGFHFFAVVVEAVGYDGFGAVFVGGDLLGREGGGVVEFFVVGPVFAAVGGGCQLRLLGCGICRGRLLC